MNSRVLGAGIRGGLVLLLVAAVTSRVGAESAVVDDSASAKASDGAPAAPARAPAAEASSITPKGDSRDAGRDRPAGTGQGNFGFGVQAGLSSPLGLALRVGAPELSLETVAGFTPLYLVFYPHGDTTQEIVKLLMPLEVTPQLVIHAVTFKDGIRGAARLGYRYNDLLGHGVALGGQIEKRVTRKLLVEALFGVNYYPKGSDRVRDKYGFGDGNYGFPPPSFSYGFSVGALLYP